MDLRFLTLALALGIDKVFGEPDFIWKKIPHPIIWFGKTLEWMELAFNNADDRPFIKRRNGLIVLLMLLALAGSAGAFLHWVLRPAGVAGVIIESCIASVFLAHKSLIDHVGAVAQALHNGGLTKGRFAVAQIVGRDTHCLDASGVCRAAIESLAENFADGVIAPAFWFVIGGLPGLFAYKMLNTADSMIGHMNARYVDFGRAAAKFDDAANYVPARLTGLIYAAASYVTVGLTMAKRSLSTMMRDAPLHRSPNSGWPEAALAGGLGIALAGPRIYKGITAHEPMINSSGVYVLAVGDIERAIALTNVAHVIFSVCILALALVKAL